jgi:hypothetical protein
MSAHNLILSPAFLAPKVIVDRLLQMFLIRRASHSMPHPVPLPRLMTFPLALAAVLLCTVIEHHPNRVILECLYLAKEGEFRCNG